MEYKGDGGGSWQSFRVSYGLVFDRWGGEGEVDWGGGGHGKRFVVVSGPDLSATKKKREKPRGETQPKAAGGVQGQWGTRVLSPRGLSRP